MEPRPLTREESKALNGIRAALIEIVNKPLSKNTDELFAAIAEWERVRQKVNDQENAGLILGFIPEVIRFPLTGDLERDMGQKNMGAKDDLDRALEKDPPSGKKN